MIAATLESKRVFRALARSASLPEGRVFRLERAEHRERSGRRPVNVVVGEPEQDDLSLVHEGEPVAYVSSEVAETFRGHVLELEAGPESVDVVLKPPSAHREER